MAKHKKNKNTKYIIALATLVLVGGSMGLSYKLITDESKEDKTEEVSKPTDGAKSTESTESTESTQSTESTESTETTQSTEQAKITSEFTDGYVHYTIEGVSVTMEKTGDAQMNPNGATLPVNLTYSDGSKSVGTLSRGNDGSANLYDINLDKIYYGTSTVDSPAAGQAEATSPAEGTGQAESASGEASPFAQNITIFDKHLKFESPGVITEDLSRVNGMSKDDTDFPVRLTISGITEFSTAVHLDRATGTFTVAGPNGEIAISGTFTE